MKWQPPWHQLKCTFTGKKKKKPCFPVIKNLNLKPPFPLAQFQIYGAALVEQQAFLTY